MLFFSVIAQIQTFILCGAASGYAFGVWAYFRLIRVEMLPDDIRMAGGEPAVETGVYVEHWQDTFTCLSALDFQSAAHYLPVLGWHFLAGFAIGSIAFVFIVNVSTIYHLCRLSSGGAIKIIAGLGAEPLHRMSGKGNLSLVPEVVTELAVDFGVPAPDTYFLPEEEGINAFIAGRKQKDAVLVATSGMRHLNRNQLRGIIAHEMAHLSNGDMVHNMRLLALELGVNSVRHTAEWMLRTGWELLFGEAKNHRSAMMAINWGCFLLILGLMIWPMGMISSFAGAAVMATSNRRRELLADKLAARVLGSWEPITDALKRIAGHGRSGKIAGAECRKLGHLMFSQANGSSGGVFGSHPKMLRRIRRGDQRWDGVPLYENPEDVPFDPSAMVDMDRVEQLLQDLDASRVGLFRETQSAQVTIPSLILYEASNRDLIDPLLPESIRQPVQMVWQCIEDLDPNQLFALTELTCDSVKETRSDSVCETLRSISERLPHPAWYAWFWSEIFLGSIEGDRQSQRVTLRDCRDSINELAIVISLATGFDGDSPMESNMRELRFQRTWMSFGLEPVSYQRGDRITPEELSDAVKELAQLPRTKLTPILLSVIDMFESQGNMSALQATYIRYLMASWKIVAPESPLNMISKSSSDAQCTFRRPIATS